MFRRMDLLLLGITIVLTLFGLAMIASVSVFESYQLTERLVNQGSREVPTNAFYLWRSFSHVIVGLLGMLFTMIVPYRLWERLALPLFALTMLLLLAVFVPGLRAEYGTAYSWLYIGSFSLQPSELLKLTFIFYLAIWLQKREQLIGTFKEGFLPFAILLTVSTMLIALQPDLGSFLVISGIAAVMFFIAGGNFFHLILGGAIAGVMGLPLILSQEYIRNRFKAFLQPGNQDLAETIGFQIKQALIAVGSGGIFGVGYGKSIQKFGYLPEVQADAIFAAMAEELGFMRLLIIITLFSTFVIRGYRIAQDAPDRFGTLVAAGITTWIAAQALINICVNLALFPLTGVTLPFISYGGSSLVSILVATGILLNISMYTTHESVASRRARRKSLQRVLRRRLRLTS